MPYTISVLRNVQKRLPRFPPDVRDQIDLAIRSLAEDPRPSGSRKLSNHGGEWRILAGAYRIIYVIDDSEQTIAIFEVWHRQRGYQ